MKRLIVYFLFATALFAIEACGKRGQEVVPEKESSSQDDTKAEVIIPNPNCKDSSEVVVKFLYENDSLPKCGYSDSTVKDGTYDSGTHKSYIINTEEEYHKLVNQCPTLSNGQVVSLPKIDFEKYSLLTGVVFCAGPPRVRSMKLIKYCDDYVFTIEFVLGAASIIVPNANYFALVPKIPSHSKIKYKIYQKFF
jgi:predicted small lipoprotein YifL